VALVLGLGWEGERGLDGLLDQSGAQATGAYANALVCTIHDRTNGLDIRIEHPSGLVVGVTDVVPRGRFL
jgi:hypothetical protein